jgi:hypothetical protein
LQFTADDPDKAPKITVHKVTLTHPKKGKTGKLRKGKSSWVQNGYCNSNIFTGWNFETEKEVLTGNYHIARHNTDGNLL